jgi:SAM-dependent methyltransferase
MSRKYLNDKYCIRCSRKTVCPYLRKNYDILIDLKTTGKFHFNVLDIGCGNGRNSDYMIGRGHDVTPLDMINDYGKKCILGQERMPVQDGSIDIILCNYLMMFLNYVEREQVISEIKRVASSTCKIMVELYPAKDSYAQTQEDMIKIQKEIFDNLGWKKLRYSKGRFIAQK